jgi:hypothetical protein
MDKEVLSIVLDIFKNECITKEQAIKLFELGYSVDDLVSEKMPDWKLNATWNDSSK